jgi:hydroxymethylpyrimidine/phosphomethylpyrimidine kinase
MKIDKQPPVCLTIAGVDPSGGAGVIADIKTFTRFGCYGTAAVASLTFQNTVGVFGSVNQTAHTVRRQVEAIFDDLDVAAMKTGMLPTGDIIREVAAIAREKHVKNFVVDPVVRSTSGYDLIDDDALRSLTQELFPLSMLITPNLPEAERITGMSIGLEADIERAADVMRSMGARNVLIKGGHSFLSERPATARDHLFIDGRHTVLEGEYYETTSTHGTGCVLAAAITANLALGHELHESVAVAKRFVNEGIRNSPGLGRGHSPIAV